jgi:hypothetical protein
MVLPLRGTADKIGVLHGLKGGNAYCHGVGGRERPWHGKWIAARYVVNMTAYKFNASSYNDFSVFIHSLLPSYLITFFKLCSIALFSFTLRECQARSFVSQSFPLLPTHSRCRGCLFSLDHTQTHTTVGRTPLEEGSAYRRNLYPTQTLYKTNIHTPVGFKLTIPASARPQTYALDSAATGIGPRTEYLQL